MDWHRKSPRMKKHHSIPGVRMGLQNYMLTGLQSITGKPIKCLPVTGFYLIMNRPLGVKHSLPVKSPGLSLELHRGFRTKNRFE
jgi:hypothetical protein